MESGGERERVVEKNAEEKDLVSVLTREKATQKKKKNARMEYHSVSPFSLFVVYTPEDELHKKK